MNRCLNKPAHIRIWHQPSGTLLVEGPKGWGITPFEGNYYIRKKYLMGDFFRSTLIPGLCPYKGIYHWMHLELPEGHNKQMLGWRYIIPNPLFPFIAFRLGLPRDDPALRVEVD